MGAALNIARRVECEADGLYCGRYFWKERFQEKMIVSAHHAAIQSALDRTMLPPDDPAFISRLIINVPPGYTKTELASINYMVRGLLVNPGARFLHLSYSDNLVLLNSGTVRATVKSAAFQALQPITIKPDVDSKKVWHTTKNGGVTATSAGGQVTGFRAGHMDPTKFTGALLIDDPVKPDDALHETVRTHVNNSYNETVASRVAIETVPIIVIMQRIHWDDLSGHLLRGGSGEKWHHLNLPVLIDNAEPYPDEYTHGIPLAHGLPDGWLWPFKHNATHEVALRAHRRRWAAQYKQRPLRRDEYTGLWTEALIGAARAKAELLDPADAVRTVVAVDPATTNTETSDEHGIMVASEYPDQQYSVDADYSRKGSPKTWADAAIHAAQAHNADALVIETNQGGDMCEDTLRNAGYKGRIIRVHGKKGKTLRAEPVAALYEMGAVAHRGGLSTYEDEALDFDPVTQTAAGKSPNKVDAAVYALLELSGDSATLRGLLSLSMGSA